MMKLCYVSVSKVGRNANDRIYGEKVHSQTVFGNHYLACRGVNSRGLCVDIVVADSLQAGATWQNGAGVL